MGDDSTPSLEAEKLQKNGSVTDSYLEILSLIEKL